LLGWYNKRTDDIQDASGRLLTTAGDEASGLISDSDIDADD